MRVGRNDGDLPPRPKVEAALADGHNWINVHVLFGRTVDLVTVGALKNPYFIEAVNKTRQLLYAVEGAEAA